jgi:hypothetical protein
MRPQPDRSASTEAAAQSAKSAYESSPVPQAANSQELDRLLAKTRQQEADRHVLEVKLNTSAAYESQLESRVKELSVELEGKKNELTAARSEGAITAQRLGETESALGKADAKLGAEEVQVTLAKADKEKLAEALAYERANAEQARALLATSKDGQGILAARNLHIVDVYDADTRGKRRSFGRIFYVENQELIFYAYDLSDPRHANAEFYAWGAGLSPGEEVARLGILLSDGKSEKRWVLKYNDASVLSKLDSIFVTAETASNPDKPKGKRVLFAVLAGQPNHP